ncbi:hypothetical protein [Kribbella rubisoli]|nr:hypothetical protein [Kribbella rubisoli]
MANVRDDQPEPLVVPLSKDGHESLTFDVGGISGWAGYHSPETEERQLLVQLRVGPETDDPDAPIEMRELRVAAQSGAAFNSAFLRTIPVARITAAINRPAIAEQLRPLLAPTNEIQADDFPGSGQWVYALPPRSRATLRPKLKIKDPGTRRRPDDFYRQVAEAYLAQASISDQAARDLAEANAVPVSTAHRWLKEARNRGLLKMPGQGGE